MTRDTEPSQTIDLPPDLIATLNLYTKVDLEYSSLFLETESSDYGACFFKLNDLSIRFRVAKITPTKSGQFVTFWKRTKGGPIEPFDRIDPIDFFVVSIRKNAHFGQFVFSKAVLLEKGILAKNGKGGKRAIRVYPPWDKTTSKQAQITQGWQLKYFLDIPFYPDDLDPRRVQALYAQRSLMTNEK